MDTKRWMSDREHISGKIAEIYMNWFEEHYVFSILVRLKPILWQRMRDDVLIIWRKSKRQMQQKDEEKEEVDVFLEEINSKEERAVSHFSIWISEEMETRFSQNSSKKAHIPKNIWIGDQTIQRILCQEC